MVGSGRVSHDGRETMVVRGTGGSDRTLAKKVVVPKSVTRPVAMRERSALHQLRQHG